MAQSCRAQSMRNDVKLHGLLPYSPVTELQLQKKSRTNGRSTMTKDYGVYGPVVTRREQTEGLSRLYITKHACQTGGWYFEGPSDHGQDGQDCTVSKLWGFENVQGDVKLCPKTKEALGILRQ